MTRDNEVLQTHYPGCWRDPRHHACATAMVERLRDIAARAETWMSRAGFCSSDMLDEREKLMAEIAAAKRGIDG